MGAFTRSRSGRVAGPANLRAGLELDKPDARLISFNVLRCNLHTYLNLSVPDDCFKYLRLYETHRRQL